LTETFREEAEAHWRFLEPLLEFPLSKEKAKHLYVEAMVHGFKHCSQQREETKP
jgi:hypothetical protein